MKLKLKIRTPMRKPLNLEKKSKPSSGMGGGVPDWMITDRDDAHEQADEAKAQRNRSFIPELWLRPDEERMVRFRHEGFISCIWCYSLKLKNGKFERVTKPAKGQVDLFQDELGLKASFKAVYEIIDIEGYVDKKSGKRKKNLPRFYVASHKAYETLEKIREKKGGLNKMNIEIARIGEGNQTTYTFMPEEKTPMKPEWLAAENLKKKFQELFAPPSEATQRSLIAQAVPNDY
jgi:hypothetical protein